MESRPDTQSQLPVTLPRPPFPGRGPLPPPLGPYRLTRQRKPLFVHDDGATWRKYGEKELLEYQVTRLYFRCAQRQCPARKFVDVKVHAASSSNGGTPDGATCQRDPAPAVLYINSHDHPVSAPQRGSRSFEVQTTAVPTLKDVTADTLRQASSDHRPPKSPNGQGSEEVVHVLSPTPVLSATKQSPGDGGWNNIDHVEGGFQGSPLGTGGGTGTGQSLSPRPSLSPFNMLAPSGGTPAGAKVGGGAEYKSSSSQIQAGMKRPQGSACSARPAQVRRKSRVPLRVDMGML